MLETDGQQAGEFETLMYYVEINVDVDLKACMLHLQESSLSDNFMQLKSNFQKVEKTWRSLCSLGRLSTRDFETRTASGSELFSVITRLHTITFIMLSTFSRLGMTSIKMWETPLSWHTECFLPVAVRVSKTRCC